MQSESALVDPKKFRSMKVTVVLKNFTLPQASKPHFELLELGAQSVTLDVPAGFCTQGHNLLLGINIPDHPHFIATAKVMSVEAIAGANAGATGDTVGNTTVATRSRVQVTLVQYDKKSWLEILSEFATRQETISSFLREVKGH